MEHRHGKRIVVHLPIRLLRSRSPLTSIGRMTNVSLSGGFIADFDLRPLTRLTITFEYPLPSTPNISSVAAFVTRRCETGIGIEWCEWKSPAVREIIRGLVNLSTPVADLIIPATLLAGSGGR
jgi:hypothetical protein